MAKFKFHGDSPLVFADLKAPDGSTVVAEPGSPIVVAEVLHPRAVLHHDLEPADKDAKALVATANEDEPLVFVPVVETESPAPSTVTAEPAPHVAAEAV